MCVYGVYVCTEVCASVFIYCGHTEVTSDLSSYRIFIYTYTNTYADNCVYRVNYTTVYAQKKL